MSFFSQQENREFSMKPKETEWDPQSESLRENPEF
jgi:hypothetical protein